MLRPYLVERPHPVQDDVGVCRHRLPEDSTLPVPGTPGLRARGRLQVVNEPLHDATFDESHRPGGHALIIQGARRDTTATQRIVGEGEPTILCVAVVSRLAPWMMSACPPGRWLSSKVASCGGSFTTWRRPRARGPGVPGTVSVGSSGSRCRHTPTSS